MPPELSDNHVAAICQVLVESGVEFVVIGGMAARLHQTGHSTVDVDICPSPDPANLERLSAALIDLGARLRVEGDPEGVPFRPHPELLANVDTMTLLTSEGPLDLCFVPAGFPDGYRTLAPRSVQLEVQAVLVPVASLEDVVTSKRTAGRPKDILALPAIEARLRDR